MIYKKCTSKVEPISTVQLWEYNIIGYNVKRTASWTKQHASVACTNTLLRKQKRVGGEMRRLL